MTTTYAVTGASGYIASNLIKTLLEKGYNVHGTVRDVSNQKKVKHLLNTVSNENQKGKLTLFEADLLKEGSFKKCFEGVSGVFHVASPFQLTVKNPQKDLVEPAINGTKNVISEAFNSKTVQRVIVTSSMASVCGDRPPEHKYTEKDWNDTAVIEKSPYPYSKVKAEQAAWELVENLTKDVKDRKFSLVVINPAFVFGPPLSDRDDSVSVGTIRAIVSGAMKEIDNGMKFGIVDVRDVVKAHISAMENEDASGRYITCHSNSYYLSDLAVILKEKFPKHPITDKTVGNKDPVREYENDKLLKLIGDLIPVEKTLVDMGNSLIDLGLVQKIE
eukprot:gene10140-2559_t